MTTEATARTGPRESAERPSISVEPAIDSEITWLLHRAAQRMRTATGEQAEKHGLQLRDYIVLSALHKTPDLTQVELAKALGLDKTTLMTQLDRLESARLIERRSDPHDRRARLVRITAGGEAVRSTVAEASTLVEEGALDSYSADQVRQFRRMLFEIIGESNDPGSCL